MCAHNMSGRGICCQAVHTPIVRQYIYYIFQLSTYPNQIIFFCFPEVVQISEDALLTLNLNWQMW